MSHRRARTRAAVVVCVLAVLAACGKRGEPLPPLRPIPARIADLAARRTADRVELSLTVPPSNADGTSPPAVDRVDVFATTLPAEAPAPTAAQLTGDAATLVGRVIVRRAEMTSSASASAPAPAAPAASAATSSRSPLPGEVARVSEVLPATADAAAAVRYYVAVAIAGTGSGRPGAPSAVLPVPLGPLPAPPVSVSLTHDESEILLSWQPSGTDQRFRVFRGGTGADAPGAVLLTPQPITEASYRVPVEFGREACFSILPLAGTAPVSVEGTPTPVQCLTPADTYPPPPPTGLQAVVESDAVTLVWTGVPASDVAGYVVLRAEAGTGDLQPLFRDPIAATTYRDGAVQPGLTYTYAVQAVDRAATPNISQRSEPQVVTVR